MAEERKLAGLSAVTVAPRGLRVHDVLNYRAVGKGPGEGHILFDRLCSSLSWNVLKSLLLPFIKWYRC